MSNVQRIVKYCATAFAILLAIGIITGIASLAFGVISTVSGGSISFNHGKGKMIDFTDTFSDVKSLDIDNSTGSFKIKVGETFRVDAENVSEKFEAKVSGNGKLKISENNQGFHFLWFDFDNFDSPNSKVTLYLPADFVANNAKLDTGAGSVSIEGLQAEELTISAGAGNITGSNITAGKVKIDGGVGSVDFQDVNFRDADFDCGVGELDIDGILLGDSEIDCGVGSVDLNLQGNSDDYDLDIDSGIGAVRVNGKKLSGKHNSNSGAENSLKIDGGVGDVNVDFAD